MANTIERILGKLNCCQSGGKCVESSSTEELLQNQINSIKQDISDIKDSIGNGNITLIGGIENTYSGQQPNMLGAFYVNQKENKIIDLWGGKTGTVTIISGGKIISKFPINSFDSQVINLDNPGSQGKWFSDSPGDINVGAAGDNFISFNIWSTNNLSGAIQPVVVSVQWGGADSDWLTASLSAQEGDGLVRVNITVQPNTSGHSRWADVRIQQNPSQGNPDIYQLITQSA